MPTPKSATHPWSLVGLAIALAGMPLVILTFNGLHLPRTTETIVGRELVILGLAAALLALVRFKERLGWDSIGLARPAPGRTALWVLITFVGVAAALAASFGLIKLFGWRFGGADQGSYDALPDWVILLVVLRAGFVEELFYRGYAIERLESQTGRRVLAVALPLLVFAVFHYRQGIAGITIALLTGAVLTAVYVHTRNLWVTITTHFLVDFVPNVLVPLFSSES